MHRNTFIFILFLALLAGSIVLVNITRRTNSNQTAISPNPTVVPTPILTNFQNNDCNISFILTGDFTRVDIENGGSTLADNNGNTLTLLCQQNLPKPTAKNSESIKIGSVAATLILSDSSASAQLTDRVFFRHPQNKKNISISGTRKVFQDMIQTLSLQ